MARAIRREAHIPLDGSANDAYEGEGDLGVPLLRRLEDEVVEGLADFAAIPTGVRKCELRVFVSEC